MKNNNNLDILQNDSTIATYNHLGKVEKGIYPGKPVFSGDVLGVAGKSEEPGKAYMQITVGDWNYGRPILCGGNGRKLPVNIISTVVLLKFGGLPGIDSAQSAGIGGNRPRKRNCKVSPIRMAACRSFFNQGEWSRSAITQSG